MRVTAQDILQEFLHANIIFHGDINSHMGANLFAGTTFTMAVLYGKLLTVANVGDSKAFVDIGSEVVELSTSHRIEDNIGKPPTL